MLVHSFNVEAARAIVCAHSTQFQILPRAWKIKDEVPGIIRMCLACQKETVKIYQNKPQRIPGQRKKRNQRKRRSDWKDPYKADRNQTEGLCKCCNINKSKLFQGLKPYGEAIYSDDKNRVWGGATCPDCIIINRRKPSHKSDYEHSCKICSKSFLGHRATRYCGTECRKRAESIQGKAQRLKMFGPPKIRPFGKAAHCKVHFLNCKTCSSLFTANYSTTMYCSESCRRKGSGDPEKKKQSRKRAKIIREKRTKCRMAKHYRSQVLEIYANRGTKEIDHIIPLNHPDVCGLHVPWNLEPITKRRNWNKSNKWDGTMDNLTFRPWAKK